MSMFEILAPLCIWVWQPSSKLSYSIFQPPTGWTTAKCSRPPTTVGGDVAAVMAHLLLNNSLCFNGSRTVARSQCSLSQTMSLLLHLLTYRRHFLFFFVITYVQTVHLMFVWPSSVAKASSMAVSHAGWGRQIVGKLNVLLVLLMSVCVLVCVGGWRGWEQAVPVDTSNVKKAGALTGAVSGIAGGSLSINPPSAANQILSPWKRGYCYLHSCQLRPKWL